MENSDDLEIQIPDVSRSLKVTKFEDSESPSTCHSCLTYLCIYFSYSLLTCHFL